MSDKEINFEEYCNGDTELLKVMNILKTGNYAKYERARFKLTQKRTVPKLLKFRDKGDWKSFCDTAISVYEVMPIAFNYFEEIPDSMKYQFLIDCYEHHGDELPKVRKYVKQMRKWGEPELPHCCEILETLVIYRAGAEDIEACKKHISWTLNANIARFFLKRCEKYEQRRIYRGLINKSDVLAYNNGREEQEIMQYNKVYSITDITNELF